MGHYCQECPQTRKVYTASIALDTAVQERGLLYIIYLDNHVMGVIKIVCIDHVHIT